PRLHHAGEAEIWMVEDIKELTLKPQLYMLGQGKPFCQVEVTPEEIRTAQSITAEVSELAVLRAVAAIAGSGGHGHHLPVDIDGLRAWIDGRYKRIRIEPLNRAQCGSGKVAMAAVGIHSRHKTGEL